MSHRFPSLAVLLPALCTAAPAQEIPRAEERIDRFVDGGGSIGSEDDPGDSIAPKLASVEDYVVAVWADVAREAGVTSSDIYLSYSWIIPAGESFTLPIRVDEDDTLRDYAPIVLAQERVTVVAWLKERPSGKVEVWARSGTADLAQGGFNWSSPPRRVSVGVSGVSKNLTGAICLPNVYLAFESDDNVVGVDDLFAATSNNDGKSWNAPLQVNDPPGLSAEVNSPRICISLPEEEDHEEEEGGPGPSTEPDCCNYAFLAWGDRRAGGHDEVWFSRTVDSGASWSANVRVDDATSVGFDADSFSIAAVECSGVFVTWVDDRSNVGVADRPWFSFSTNAFDGFVTPTFAPNADLSTQGLLVDANHAQVAATHDLDVVVAWTDDRRGAGRQDVILDRGSYDSLAGTVAHGGDENITVNFPPTFCRTPVLRASEGAVGVAFLAPRHEPGWTRFGALHPWLAFWDDTLAAPSWQLLHLATLAPRDQTMERIDFNLGDHHPWEGHIAWSTVPPATPDAPRQIWIGGLDRDHGTGRPNNAPYAGAAIDPP